MNIAQMKVAIRPMSTTQAIDLGMMMTRQWFVPLWKIWVGMALPAFIILSVILSILGMLTDSNIGMWGGLLFWWLKPIYEKPMLTWLSQALFANVPDVKSTVKQGWREGRYFSGNLLVRYRLSPQRQLIIPIALLERPNKAQFKQRLAILSRGQGGGLTWHTIVMANIEGMIAIAFILTLVQLVPTSLMSMKMFLQYLELSPLWFELLWSTLYFIAASIVAPFFITGGFAVYLTKRCLLEGWDVELVFKQLRYRYEQGQVNPLTTLKNEYYNINSLSNKNNNKKQKYKESKNHTNNSSSNNFLNQGGL